MMADGDRAGVVSSAMDALPPPHPPTMTAQEFLAWEPGDGQAWQLIDGEPRQMAPTNRTHGALQMELARLVANHLEETGSPCSVIGEPGIQPRVMGSTNVRIPDFAVSCTPYSDEEPLLNGAVLLVEVLSHSNQAETWSNVWTYTTIPSVQEILVLHSATVAADIIRRGPGGVWPDTPQRIVEGDLVLESVGLTVPLRRVYRTTRFA